MEVKSDCYVSEAPLFYPEGAPIVVRFHVQPLHWLERVLTLSIREDYIWNALSFTRQHDKASSNWTGKFTVRMFNPFTNWTEYYPWQLFRNSWFSSNGLYTAFVVQEKPLRRTRAGPQQ